MSKPPIIESHRFLADAAATAAAAAALARHGDIFCLYGDLGAGKTTFARGFLRALAVAEEIPSPTFNLVLDYDTALGTVWHFDLYRLTAPDEVIELGIEDAFAGGICLIEWPDRLGPWLPKQRLEIHLSDGRGGAGRHLHLRAIRDAAGAATDDGMAADAERWREPW